MFQQSHLRLRQQPPILSIVGMQLKANEPEEKFDQKQSHGRCCGSRDSLWHFVPISRFTALYVGLLVPQSGAHLRGAFRGWTYIQPNPIHLKIAFEHKSLFIQQPLSQSVAFPGKVVMADLSRARHRGGGGRVR